MKKKCYTKNMKEYRQWHDEGTNEFHSETTIYFSQCNVNKKLSFYELLKLTSDCAVEDFAQRGMDREVLLQNNCAILVSRVSFRAHRMPLENERITIHTWEEKSEVFQFRRAYEITSEDGTKLVSGMSTWLLVEPKERKLIPIKEFTLRKPTDRTEEHDCLEPGRISIPKEAQLVAERKVLFTDIDCNGHVNNARYGAFVMDSLPAEWQLLDFTDYRLNYAREALLGDTLSVYAYHDEEAHKISVVGKRGKETSFDCELFYRA